jgi:hypothetical protein
MTFLSGTMSEKISEYTIVYAFNLDIFTESVDEHIRDGWQPLNRHGFQKTDEGTRGTRYSLELVKTMEEREYWDMVYDARDEYADMEERVIQEPAVPSERAREAVQRYFYDARTGDIQEHTEESESEIRRRISALSQSNNGIPHPEIPDELVANHFDEDLFNE